MNAIEKIRAEIERRKKVNLEEGETGWTCVDEDDEILHFIDQLPAEPVPADIREAEIKKINITPSEVRYVIDAIHSYAGIFMTEDDAKKGLAIFKAGEQHERERMMKEIQKNTIEDGYIARDERGRLVYSNRKLEREWDPERSDGGWYPDDDIEGFDGMLSLPDKWFPEVRWADLPKKAKLIILKEGEK